MITINEEQTALRFVGIVAPKTTGVRIRCSFCGVDLIGSDPTAARVSHGACKPLCPQAKAMGWEDQ